jgi:uncharacterized protein (UPF0262 family)
MLTAEDVNVNVAVPVTFPQVPWTVTVPAVAVDDTVTTPVLLLTLTPVFDVGREYVTVCPVRILLFASRTVAVAVDVTVPLVGIVTLLGVSVTVRLDGTTAVRVRTAVPVMFPQVPLTVTVPAVAVDDTVTTPLLPLTLTPVFEVVSEYVTVCPVSTLLFASRTVAVAVDVAVPLVGIVTVLGVSVTERLAGIITNVNVAVPVIFPQVPLTVTVPASAVDDTVTTPVLLLTLTPVFEVVSEYVTVCPVSTLLFASRTTAVAVAVAVPLVGIVTLLGVSVTVRLDGTAVVRVSTAVPVTLPQVPWIVTVPAVAVDDTVTTPVLLSMLTPVFDVGREYVTVCPVRMLSSASRTVAVAVDVTVPFVGIVTLFGVSVTVRVAGSPDAPEPDDTDTGDSLVVVVSSPNCP